MLTKHSCKTPLSEPIRKPWTTGPVCATRSFHFCRSTAGSVQVDSWFMSSHKHFTALLLSGRRWKPSCFAGTSGAKQPRAAMCRKSCGDFPMNGRLLPATVQMGLQSPLTSFCRLCLSPSWGEDSWVFQQDLARWGLHWRTGMPGSSSGPSFGRLSLSLPLGLNKLWPSFQSHVILISINQTHC